MVPRLIRWSLTVAALAVLGLVPPALAARITGTATYRERVALTREAVLEVTLEDASRADAPGLVIEHRRMEDPGQVPIAFEIFYDPRRIDARKRYALRASIYEGGELRFTNQQAYPVLTYGHVNKVSVLLRRVTDAERRSQPRPGSGLGNLPATFAGMLPCADCVGVRYQINLLPDGAYMQRTTQLRDGQDVSFSEVGAWSLSRDGRTLTLEGGRVDATRWAVRDVNTLEKLDRRGAATDPKLSYEVTRRPSVEPMEPRVQMTGMFRYMVDAPRFRDCRSGLRWPVAMNDEYLTLERAYIAQRGAPGSELQVLLDARIEQRPAMEGDATEPTLVVEKFVRAIPGQNCRERGDAGTGLGNTRWRPVRIGDRDVVVTGQEREPWIMLEPRYLRVTGSGGCNRISGNYDVGEGTLTFGKLATTMMACPTMDTEAEFIRALENTRRYRVRGRTLDLMDGGGRVLVRLEERNLS